MRSSTKKLIAIALTAVMLSSVVGMVGAQELRPQTESQMDANATVTFSDQTTDGTSVTVDSVNVSDGGFVVIHDDSLLEGEVTGSVIGVSEYLEPGETENVTVTLFDGVPGATFDQTELSEDETLIAMPHRDTNANETYDFVATNGSEDGPYVANGSAVTDSANVSVETPQTAGESFVVTDLAAPEVVERGDAVDVTATVENPNDEADTQTVEYRFDGNVSVSEEVSLDAGESTEISTSVNTSALASGVYIHGVYTREDGRPAQVRIADEIVSFGVTDLSAPENVTAGDNVTVNATVENPNEFGVEQPIQFRFDGDLVETRDVDLDGESSTTVQFEIGTEGTPPGTYIHSVFSNDFGQDAIITVEAPGDAPPTDGEDDGAGENGEDGDDAEDGEDGEDGDDAGDGADAEDGADGEDGEDGDDAEGGADGEDGEDGDDAEGGADGEDGEDTDDGEDGEDGDDAEDGADGEDGEDADDGENAENGDDADDGEDTEDGEDAENGDDTQDGEDADDGENAEGGDDGGNDTDEEQPETPEDG